MIGQILVEKGYIKLSQLNEARRKQLNWYALTPIPGKCPLIGEIMVQLGHATSAQVEEALKLQEGHTPSSPSAPNPNL